MLPKRTKILFAVFFSCFFILLLVTPVLAQENTGLTPPRLQINIPTLQFSDQAGNWTGEYIAAIYKYAVGVVGIVAAVVMMFGGVLWLTSGGDSGKVSEAKEWIKASLLGLIIALGSYTILYVVNPALVSFSSLDIDKIQYIPLSNSSEQKASRTAGWSDTARSPFNVDINTIPWQSFGVDTVAGGRAYIQTNEGIQLQPYSDAGFYSVGYGHFLTQTEYDNIMAAGGRITQLQADQWFIEDYAQAVADAQSVAAEYNITFSDLSIPRQNVLTDMAYNLGHGDISQRTGLAGFRNTLTAVNNNDWQTAANEILNSRYANQVGQRALRNAAIMLNGD